MRIRSTQYRLYFVMLLLLAVPVGVSGDERCPDHAPELESTLVRMAANRLDSTFGAVADSTRALGDTYGRLFAAQENLPSEADRQWAESSTKQGAVTGFRSWPAGMAAPPDFQAPYPGFYSYQGASLSKDLQRQLNLFKKLVPTFRSAYESFPFSWVYFTTADDVMMIYPYVPIDQAVNNGTPTQTLYYKAAKFEQRAVGWTAPYLDLVGAGMMVTASYPVYAGDTLLGVMSRDITLAELLHSVLDHLTGLAGSSAMIVDRQGLLIDTTDEARASGAVPMKELVERVLDSAADDQVVRLNLGSETVLAAPVNSTGWLVVLRLPHHR